MNKKFFLTGILALAISGAALNAQVTVGALKAPQTFSVLELISKSQRGMRLPQLNTDQRTALEQSADFQNQKTGLARGLTIFNTDNNCMETWNGSEWISLCSKGTINSLDCASVTGINVTEGTAADKSASLPYSGLTGGNIPLTDGQVLGRSSGLSVVIDGPQTLSAPSGNLAIKITGTATVYGTINIPINLPDASCSISVAAAQPAGRIGSLDCAAVTGITVTEGTAADKSALLPYSEKTGADIVLTDGQELGSVSGLSVQIKGAQTLSAAAGTINIKITGTAVTHGTIDIPISLAGASCSISITAEQQGGEIGSLDCAAVTDINVTQGITANIPATLPYSEMTGADISVADGMVLGTISGLSVVANGAQTLVAPGGNIAIKITGTASVTGTTNIPVSLAGASCAITVTSNVNPGPLPTGSGTFKGRFCFDVVETNQGSGCGTLAGRASQKVNFTVNNCYDYTFTPVGTVSNVRFYIDDPTGKVILSFSPASYPDNVNTPQKVNVCYQTNLNQTAAGLSRENALKATIYVVYNSGGKDYKLQQDVAIQDCACCPGYLSVRGEYVQNTPGYIDVLPSPAGFSALVPNYFTATGNDLCFFMTDNPSRTTFSGAQSYCANYMNATWAYLGWRLPSAAELGYIDNNVALSMSTSPFSVEGTTNMQTTAEGGGTSAAYYITSTQRNDLVDWGWSFGQGPGNAQQLSKSLSANNRCVTTFFK